MICKAPFFKGSLAFGCGKCLPCRLRARKVWTHRMLLESKCHEYNSFISLTYEKNPITLIPKDLQLFFKRLRSNIEPKQIRFFAVGEYGEQNERPHYHAIIFGLPGCTRNFTTQSDQRIYCTCTQCELIRTTWGKGLTDAGHFTREAAQYCAGYVTKKLTNPNDDRVREWLKGRHQEFARMSRNPGIGAGFVDKIVQAVQLNPAALQSGDSPGALRHGSKLMPLGRYMKGKIREKIFTEEQIEKIKSQGIQRQEAEMHIMFEDNQTLTCDPFKWSKGGKKRWYSEINKQKILNQETKFELYETKRRFKKL